MNEKFDPGLEHHYLVQEARRSGSTLTKQEKIDLLIRKYGVSHTISRKAVEHAGF